MAQIKVLWIEDQSNSDLCKPFKVQASLKGIELIAKDDWLTGREFLENPTNRESISAIVLDCYCKLDSKNGECDTFLAEVIPEIEAMTDKYQKLFPWYVLSAGSRDSFKSIIKYSLTRKRLKWDAAWEKVYYSKMNEDDDIKHLIEHITNVATLDKDYQLREMYGKIIKVLESDYFDTGSSSILMKILKPLHFSEERHTFDALLHYNQVRQFVEKIFRACHNQGLVPNECIKDGKVNLWESYNYLSGKRLRYNTSIRYGEDGETVLPNHYSGTIGQILFISNEMSHSKYVELTDEDKDNVRKYLEEVGTAYYLYGYALQLCDIVVWLGKYFSEHDVNANKEKIKHVITKENVTNYRKKDERTFEDLMASYKGKTFLIKTDRDGKVHCGEKCMLHQKYASFANKGMATLTEIKVNTNASAKDKYPLYCPIVEIKQI